MGLFQKSVLSKYLKLQDKAAIEKAFKKFSKYFHNPTVQENIKKSKEEQFQSGFLTKLFVEVLGYTLSPDANFNLTTEFKNQKGAKKADGAILKSGEALAVIELKGTKTKDLESIRQQAFDYKANHTSCIYVVTSNFEKIRFYINNAVDFEEFNLFTLSPERFTLLYLCLHKENLLKKNLPLQIKTDSVVEEESITKKFYADYSLFKRELYRDLVKRNMKNSVFRAELEKDDSVRASKNIKLTLFKKSQKLIDRFLFIFFAEDRGLLPPNSTLKILEQWDKLQELDEEVPLYKRYQKYFNYLDTGRKGTDKRTEIFAYNGGLFKPDTILDSLLISNELLYKYTKALSNYDFESQVDVNILGHIFENSLNEIESINAEIEGVDFDKQNAKRKKDGVFYTPKYITKYIVDNTVGKLCSEKKEELGVVEDEYLKSRKGRPKKTLLDLQQKLKYYREWLLTLTILDPACGSGAFLNQTLDFLIKEHHYLDELEASLIGSSIVFPDIENTVLERNIFGVDLNEESVEIAKLSLWLRTAQPRRRLNTLSSNIKCGNSLIDGKTAGGDKAFNWQEEFSDVFANGGFDIIIGNPPYGDYFNDKEKTFLLKKYSTSFSGTFDMYIVFFDLALRITKLNGFLSFITPNTFIDYAQFSGLRNTLQTGNNIKQVIGLTKVFQDAIVDTAIILLRKGEKQGKHFKGKTFKYGVTSLEETDLPELESANLTNAGFNLKSTGKFNVSKVIENQPNKLGDIIKLTQGITTGGNDSFLNSLDYFLAHSIPKEILKPTLKGKTINRYRILQDDDFVLYSTKQVENSIQANIAELLDPYKEKLSRKRETKQGKLPWYCLHWSRSEKDFNEPKILIRQTASHIIGVLDNQNHYPIDTIHTLNLKTEVGKDKKEKVLKFILGLLNSKLFKYLYNWKLDEEGKVYPQVKKVNIEWLPLPNYDESEVISELVDEISSIIIKQEKLIRHFIKYLQSQYSLEKLSIKLKNWHELEFAEFIKELNKAIKKAGGAKLSKSDEMEWMELFETKKKEALAIKAEIDKTDREINQLVYELYDLTEDEIELVEQA